MRYSVKEIEAMLETHFAGKSRLEHSKAVAKRAKELAITYGADPDKAYLAGLVHDWCKYFDDAEMIKWIDDSKVVERFKTAPQIYHAYASANYAKIYFEIEDEEIINAIRYHVYGRLNMTLLEKIMVMADYTDETRTYPDCLKVKEMLDKGNLELALYTFIDNTIEYVKKRNFIPIPEELEIKEQLKNEVKEWTY